MTLPLYNNGDVGTDEAAVTTGNSGSGNGTAWDSVSNTAGGGGAVFDQGQGRWGAGAYRLDVGTSVGNVFLVWSTALGGPLGSITTRHYFKMSALPSSNLVIMQLRGSAANRGLIRVQSSGIPQILNAASTAIYTAPSALPTGKWIRLESRWSFNATTGHVETQWFWDDDPARTCDGLTPSMSVGVFTDNQALGGTDLDTVNLGASAGIAQTAAASHWIDEVSYQAGTVALPVGPPTEWWAATATGLQPLRSAYAGEAA